MQRIDGVLNPLEDGRPTPFISGPAEFLCATLALQLKSVPQWCALYGEFIDGYQRMDYPLRSLPVLRIYTEGDSKDYETWYTNGDIIIDSILPPSIRRNDTQQIQDTLASAMLQQFRRPSFFEAVSQSVPGLNELGKRFVTDKTLGYNWQENEELAPLTRMRANFRINLNEWDNYLTSTNRTKDDPFECTLANLTKIATVIRSLEDDLVTTGVNLPQTGVDIFKIP